MYNQFTLGCILYHAQISLLNIFGVTASDTNITLWNHCCRCARPLNEKLYV